MKNIEASYAQEAPIPAARHTQEQVIRKLMDATDKLASIFEIPATGLTLGEAHTLTEQVSGAIKKITSMHILKR